MRLRLAALLVTALGLVLAPSAGADPPLRIPLFFGPLTLTGACDFPVLFEVLDDQQNQKLIVFSDGRQIINGQLRSRVTNLDDPSKVWEGTTSGPVFIDPLPDGSFAVTGTGMNIWYFFPGNLGEGEPGAVFLVRGLSTEVLDPSGVPVTGSFEHHGYVENLCETLA